MVTTTKSRIPDWRTDESLVRARQRVAELEAQLPGLAAQADATAGASAQADTAVEDVEIRHMRGNAKPADVQRAQATADKARQQSHAAKLAHRGCVTDLAAARTALQQAEANAKRRAVEELQAEYRQALKRLDAVLAEAEALSQQADALFTSASQQFPLWLADRIEPSNAGLPQAAWVLEFGQGGDDWSVHRQRKYQQWRRQLADLGWL